MSDEFFSAAPVMARLKDFQRRTVDYVFKQLYAEGNSGRFLVADEVGLGKTLVARGVIAKTLEHLQHIEKRVDVIYVCSNAAIAEQNVNRLNVGGNKEFAIASRLTFLPIQVKRLSANKVNFVSFTPGTTFDLKSRGGRVEERALLHRMLKGAAWDVGRGLLNMLQGTVYVRENWMRWIRNWSAEPDSDLTAEFRRAVEADTNLMSRLTECCDYFKRYRENIPIAESELRYELIGELRSLLAKICLNALEPDLVILDEFQRFKDLLDGQDDAAELAKALFTYPKVRTLLLSATPYKMLSLDHEQEDDHYPDFLRTLQFLFNDPVEVDLVRQEIQEYRKTLFCADAVAGSSRISAAKDTLQGRLLKVMCRTERVGMTRRLDAMLVEPPKPSNLQPADLKQAFLADRAARAVGAHEPIEYWKSSPYLLNFLKHYQLRRKIDAVADAPPKELLEAIQQGDGQLLKAEMFDDYQEVIAANARMRTLYGETLDKGLWRLLWLPPSMPYSQPDGEYENIGTVTKSLVFSAWNVVPDAIAALCSYEAERRMMQGLDRTIKHSMLYDRVKPLLRFTKGADDRLTGMPTLAWLMPSPTLAGAIDPLEIAVILGDGNPIKNSDLISYATGICEQLLLKLPEGEAGIRPDERWYWAAVALLDVHTGVVDWYLSAEGWMASDDDKNPGARFRDHLQLMAKASKGKIELGPRPKDLATVLAELALAGPGNCALRALRRIAPEEPFNSSKLLSAASRVAEGFRTLFNLPETIAFLRGAGEDSYWHLTLKYALDGNIQSMLDEHVHTLVESLGLTDHDALSRADGVSKSLSTALSLRTAQIKVDELQATETSLIRNDFNCRCRFALRFGDLRDDSDSTLARADSVREAFNSPFRPFILVSTSIGQEGLDFHTWCHAVVHWNLPSNPVDLEQREGRIHRYKGHAVRKNVAEKFGLSSLLQWEFIGDPWVYLFQQAAEDRAPGISDLVPYWIYEEGAARVERHIPLIPFSKEVQHLDRLKRSLALYRLVFGQPRQEDLLAHLTDKIDMAEAGKAVMNWGISLEPPRDATCEE
jgi:hypothetical protein